KLVEEFDDLASEHEVLRASLRTGAVSRGRHLQFPTDVVGLLKIRFSIANGQILNAAKSNRLHQLHHPRTIRRQLMHSQYRVPTGRLLSGRISWGRHRMPPG